MTEINKGDMPPAESDRPYICYLRKVGSEDKIKVEIIKLGPKHYKTEVNVLGKSFTGECRPGDTADDHPGYAAELIVNQLSDEFSDTDEWYVEYASPQ